MDWRQSLVDHGVTVAAAADPEHVYLRDEEHPSSPAQLTELLVGEQTLHPSRVRPRKTNLPGLLIVRSATDAAVDAAQRRGWSVVSQDGVIELRLPNRSIHQRPTGTNAQVRKRGRPGWAQWKVTRTLLAMQDRCTQSELAVMAGVSQPTVFRTVDALRELGLVDGGKRGARAPDRRALADWWLANYPGPGGVDSYWYSLDPVEKQVVSAVRALKGCVLSGAAAADLMAPWQKPDQARIYTRTPALLGGAGFVPVATAADATLIVTAPFDPGVWTPVRVIRHLQGQEVALADLLQVVCDVQRSPSSDADTAQDAARHLLEALLGPLGDQWSASRAVRGGTPA